MSKTSGGWGSLLTIIPASHPCPGTAHTCARAGDGVHWPCRNDDFELTTLESRCLSPSARVSILGICLPIWLARALAVFVWGGGCLCLVGCLFVCVWVCACACVFSCAPRAYLYSPPFTAHTHSLSVGSFVCAADSHDMFFSVSS